MKNCHFVSYNKNRGARGPSKSVFAFNYTYPFDNIAHYDLDYNDKLIQIESNLVHIQLHSYTDSGCMDLKRKFNFSLTSTQNLFWYERLGLFFARRA